MNREEFLKLSLSEQVEYYNTLLAEGQSLSQIEKDIGISNSKIQNFKEHGYKLIENQLILQQIEEQEKLLADVEVTDTELFNADLCEQDQPKDKIDSDSIMAQERQEEVKAGTDAETLPKPEEKSKKPIDEYQELYEEYLKMYSEEFIEKIIGYVKIQEPGANVAIRVDFKSGMWLRVYKKTQDSQIEWHY
jgi:hypothetical protein